MRDAVGGRDADGDEAVNVSGDTKKVQYPRQRGWRALVSSHHNRHPWPQCALRGAHRVADARAAVWHIRCLGIHD